MGNVFVSAAPIMGKAFLESILAAYGTRPAGALVNTPKVRLSKDPSFNPRPTNAIADFAAMECDFSGYTGGGYALTLGSTAVLSDDAEGVLGHVVAEAASATPQVGNNVYGYWIDDGTNVIQAEAFGGAGPIGVGSPGDIVELNLRLPLMYQQTVA